jgi:hypothetical protein
LSLVYMQGGKASLSGESVERAAELAVTLVGISRN